MSPNEKLLKAIRERGEGRSPFGEGILTADRYVKTLRECVGSDLCYRYAASKETSFDDVLRKAARTLTYRNPDMMAREIWDGSKVPVGVADNPEIELPKNTLMVFRHVLTTPRKDRDGDILRTEGAVVDPKMLLLWQHVHTLPIGKMLAISRHDSKALELISAIVDMNELCHDAAVMVDNGMARFSHGFRALEFEQLKEEEGATTSPGGFDVKRFEIMEESLVSVPSNKEAETEEVILSLVEGDKLTSGLMKEYGRTIRARRPKQFAGVDLKEIAREEIRRALKGAGDEKQRAGEAAGAGGACGCGGGKQAGAPEQKNGAAEGEGQAAVGAEDSEVKNGGTLLDGSWEQLQKQLSEKAKRYLQAMGVGSAHDMVYLIATYPNRIVVCCEKPEYGVEDEYRYFEIDWELRDGKPELSGDPRPVEIVTTAEMRERSPLWEQKQTKAIDLSVSRGMVEEARRGLEWREEHGRGGTQVGVTRANQIINDGELSEDTWRRVKAYFDRHQSDKDAEGWSPGEDGYPSAGRIAWALWGGDPGWSRAKRIVDQLEDKGGQPEGEKAGARISRANREKLADVREDVNELYEKEEGISRGGKALCRGCLEKLDEVIGEEGEPDGETSAAEMTAKRAAAEFLVRASREERRELEDGLRALRERERKNKERARLRKLLGR